MRDEQVLPGGFTSTVTRVGDSVRRTPSSNAAFVRSLLLHLEHAGWRGAPRHLGSDERGREPLAFVDGVTLAERPDLGVGGDTALVATARLVRELHDLTAGTPLAGEAEVVCHNDLDPRNTVYRDTAAGVVPIAFIDWDLAAPGRRIHDVAHVCWQYLCLGPTVASVPEAARRLRLICDSCVLDDRGELLDTIVWWQTRCWRGILDGAAAGDPALLRIRDAGVADVVREAAEWTEIHAEQLAAGLTSAAPLPPGS